MTDGAAFVLGTGIDGAPIEVLVLDGLRAQRLRLLGRMRAATDEEWRAPTRCTEWNAQEVVLHLCGANDALRSALSDERAVVSPDFDPRTTPNLYVDLHKAETPADSLARLEATTADVLDVVARTARAGHDEPVSAVWGSPVDWRLLTTHLFWDCWLHERDILLARGTPQPTTGTEARVAAAYGLLVAGVMAGFLGTPLDVELHLGGTGAASFTLHVDGLDDVTVTVDPAGAPAAVQGETPTVADALAGRGPEVGEVLDAPPALVEVLGHLRAFLLTPV